MLPTKKDECPAFKTVHVIGLLTCNRSRSPLPHPAFPFGIFHQFTLHHYLYLSCLNTMMVLTIRRRRLHPSSQMRLTRSLTSPPDTLGTMDQGFINSHLSLLAGQLRRPYPLLGREKGLSIISFCQGRNILRCSVEVVISMNLSVMNYMNYLL
jgi:hypothetical protein